jgi:large subunit ribosomal protein L1|tara:strand:+ start:23 stop:712 length:690 start_codon:yes stop_codon:yes gene_type:complete
MKRVKANLGKIEIDKKYDLKEAILLVKDLSNAKFDETIEIHIKTGCDPKDSEQNIRGYVNLPHGSGRNSKIAVFAQAGDTQKAETAGADYVGATDLIDRVSKGWIDFDIAISTPEMMGNVSKIGKELGTRGLMPSPRNGTVVDSGGLESAIKQCKSGRAIYKLDSNSNIHSVVGKASFDDNKIEENTKDLINTINSSRPSKLKGDFLINIHLASTMGPSVKLDIDTIID